VSTAAGQLARKAAVVTGGYQLVIDVNAVGTFRLAKYGTQPWPGRRERSS
jgi:hypothetical protein